MRPLLISLGIVTDAVVCQIAKGPQRKHQIAA